MTFPENHALIGTEPRHYERLGLNAGEIQTWEDGWRTNTAAQTRGTFEWWYFDAHLDDGSTVTVEMHTKPPYVSPGTTLTPFVLMTTTSSDGTRIDRTLITDPDTFAAAIDDCDVKIGNSFFRRTAAGYHIHVEIDDTTADFTLRPEVAPWRPASGHVFFGAEEQHYIAWLAMVPRGAVEATIVVDGQTRQLSGTGYHDHNWGNVAPRKVLDHWYWGRARVGDYTVVSLMFVSHARYEKAPLPAVMVARDGEVLASAVGPDAIRFTGTEVATHAETGVPVARRLEYCVADGADSLRVAFHQRHDVSTLDFGAAGAYLRFLGDVTVERNSDGILDAATGGALWELLYFRERAATPDIDPKAPAEMVIGHLA
jgi:predicted secreted hydrolase